MYVSMHAAYYLCALEYFKSYNYCARLPPPKICKGPPSVVDLLIDNDIVKIPNRLGKYVIVSHSFYHVS